METTHMEKQQDNPATHDRAHFKIGVDDYGRIEITGTNAFVQFCTPHIQPILQHLIEKYAEAEVAKGRTYDEVANEFLSSLEGELKRALADPGDTKAVAVHVGD